MTTRQSTTLHLSDDTDDRNGIAFSTISEMLDDPNSEREPVLEIWGTIFAPDGQPLNAKLQVGMPDVQDIQAFLADQFGRARHEAKAAGEYPYKSGDVLVLGPEVFISADGQVLSYAGANWVPAASTTTTQQDGLNAQYFKDGWMASLRELLEMSKVRGYDEAINWAKGRLGAYVGPAALSADGFPETPGDLAYYAEQDGAWQPKPGDTVHVVTMGVTDAKTGTVRQCAVIYNGIQCGRADGHQEDHLFTSEPMHQPDVDLFQEQAAAINATPQDLSDNPRSEQHPDNADLRNEAEKTRSRRLKVEMTFDKALDAHKAAPSDESWAALVEALKAVEKKEPDNSRVRRGLASLQNTAAEPTATEAAQVPQPAEPGPTFAPEQPPAYQSIPNNGYDPSLHAAEEQFEQQAAQATAPPTYQQTSPNTGLPQPAPALDPASQQAAAAFPCVARHSQTGQQCQRPAGHDIETPQRPPTPHMFATDPSTLGQPAPAAPPTYVPPAAPPQGFPSQPVAQAGGQAMPVAHLHAVPNQPLALHEGEPGMPSAPAMPTWTAPQQ